MDRTFGSGRFGSVMFGPIVIIRLFSAQLELKLGNILDLRINKIRTDEALSPLSIPTTCWLKMSMSCFLIS